MTGIFIVIFVCFSGCEDHVNPTKEYSNSNQSNREVKTEFPQKYVNDKVRLLNISYWFIEEGLSLYYLTNDKTAIKNYVLKQGALLYGQTAIEEYGLIAQFVPQTQFYRNSVMCYKRQEERESVYEYWVIKEWGINSILKYRNCSFLITKSKNTKGKRTILYVSDQFFDFYKVDQNISIYFPTDLEAIYRLKAWDFPGNFRNSELLKFKVVYSKDKGFQKVPL